MKKQKSFLALVILMTTIPLIIVNCKKSQSDIEFDLMGKSSLSKNITSNLALNLDEDNLVLKFIKSSNFKSNPLIASLQVDLNKSKVSYYKEDKSKPIITVSLTKNNEIVASVEAVCVEDEKLTLPNGARYFMLFRDFSKFNSRTLSGKIEFYDMNFDNHHIGEVDYSNKIAKAVKISGLTSELKMKYNDIFKSNAKYIQALRKQKKSLPSVASVSMSESGYNGLCDFNKDGDLSFSECFACFNSSCASLPECFTLCFGLGDTFSWVVLGLPQCQIAITSACIVLSLSY